MDLPIWESTLNQTVLASMLKNLMKRTNKASVKAVFHPHIPVRIPCYDLSPVTGFTLGHSY